MYAQKTVGTIYSVVYRSSDGQKRIFDVIADSSEAAAAACADKFPFSLVLDVFDEWHDIGLSRQTSFVDDITGREYKLGQSVVHKRFGECVIYDVVHPRYTLRVLHPVQCGYFEVCSIGFAYRDLEPLEK